MATPTAQQLKARAYMAYGDTAGDERILLDYTEASTTTGFQNIVIPKELAASATDTTVDLSTFVDTATFIAVRDRNNTGVKVGLASAGKMTIAANGFIMFKNGVATPPTLYLDNVSASDKAFIEILILGTSA